MKNNEDQYSLKKIILIWSVVTIPMPLLAFIVTPFLKQYTGIHISILFWVLMVIGMLWQFVVSMWVIYKEFGSSKWAIIKKRTWLNAPFDPKTGKKKKKLFLWLIPATVAIGLFEYKLAEPLSHLLLRTFPFLSKFSYVNMEELLDPQFIGAWWLLPLALISCLFNYLLGEEFFFRGILLPKMKGVFGKYDWLANSFMFGLYHLHKPWMIPSIIITSIPLTLTSAKFRSNWFAVILHGVEGLFILLVVLGVVTGLAF